MQLFVKMANRESSRLAAKHLRHEASSSDESDAKKIHLDTMETIYKEGKMHQIKLYTLKSECKSYGPILLILLILLIKTLRYL